MKLLASIAHLPAACQRQWAYYTSRNDLDSMLDLLVMWSEYRDVLLATIGRAALRGMCKIEDRSQGKTRDDAVANVGGALLDYTPWHLWLAQAA